MVSSMLSILSGCTGETGEHSRQTGVSVHTCKAGFPIRSPMHISTPTTAAMLQYSTAQCQDKHSEIVKKGPRGAGNAFELLIAKSMNEWELFSVAAMLCLQFKKRGLKNTTLQLLCRKKKRARVTASW